MHGAHVAFDDAPVVDEKVPAGHAVGFTEENEQKDPAGQRTGVPDAQK